jgi:hypothetical protein
MCYSICDSWNGKPPVSVKVVVFGGARKCSELCLPQSNTQTRANRFSAGSNEWLWDEKGARKDACPNATRIAESKASALVKAPAIP